MTKKKIGELDGTPIVTGDKNYANEHEYYMTLNGDNSYQKLEQRTNGDLFRLVLGGGCNCSDYQSSGSVVKDMIEQGTNFNWAKYAIDVPSLPCFDQGNIAKLLADRDDEPTLVDSLLEEGYATLKVVINENTGGAVWFVVKVTGETPSATYTFNPEHKQPEAEDFAFVDCEPVRVSELEKADVLFTGLIPTRSVEGFSNDGDAAYVDYMSITEQFSRFSGIIAFPLLVVASYEGFV